MRLRHLFGWVDLVVSLIRGVVWVRILAVVRHPCGGIRTYLRYVYGRLPAAYRITLLTVRHPEVKVIRQDLAGHLEDVGTVPKRRAFWHLAQAAHSNLTSGNFDLVHSHGFTAGAAVALVNSGHVPHVITSHDVFQPEQFSGVVGALKAVSLARLLGRADAIQSVSGDAQANLRATLSHLPRSCLLATSLNGIDVAQFASRNQRHPTLRAELGYDTNVLLVGFLGRLMPQKGFDLLIDAVRLLSPRPRPFRILVYSQGGYMREYQQRINALRLESYFHWRGFAADTAPILHALDAVAMPSRWEACGVLAMEALVAGCPLIASTCPGLREVIAGSPTIAVPPENAEDLAGAIAYSSAYREDVKSSALAYMPIARTRFDAGRVAADLEGLFRRVIDRRQSEGSSARQANRFRWGAKGHQPRG